MLFTTVFTNICFHISIYSMINQFTALPIELLLIGGSEQSRTAASWFSVTCTTTDLYDTPKFACIHARDLGGNLYRRDFPPILRTSLCNTRLLVLPTRLELVTRTFGHEVKIWTWIFFNMEVLLLKLLHEKCAALPTELRKYLAFWSWRRDLNPHLDD